MQSLNTASTTVTSKDSQFKSAEANKENLERGATKSDEDSADEEFEEEKTDNVVANGEKKKKKKKGGNARNWRFAKTIGVEDNANYPKFKDKERLLINMANTKYFVIRWVAKHLFNFKLSFKQQEVDQMESGYPEHGGTSEDWDIFWTDVAVLPERIAKMKPY